MQEIVDLATEAGGDDEALAKGCNEGGVPTRYEYEALRADGGHIMLQCTVSVVRWQGRPAIQATVVDVTEQRQAQDALRESEARMSAFFDFGNVYGPDESFDIGQFRYSLGMTGTWISPLGPLTLSLAAPLGKQSGDDTEVFQFMFGTTF